MMLRRKLEFGFILVLVRVFYESKDVFVVVGDMFYSIWKIDIEMIYLFFLECDLFK